jgi:hypothetical protein
MRALGFVFSALFLLAPAGAQSQTRPGGARPMPPPQVPAPPVRPTVPVSPPITYPFPPLMPPPAGGLTPPAGGLPPRVDPAYRPGRRNPLFFPYGSGGYSAPYGYGVDDTTTPAQRTPAPAEPPTGLLRLAVTPASAQVFVDSYYVGTVEDIEAQRVLRLEAGPHRIEMRAPQYRTLTVDVRVAPLETVTYRGALEPIRPQSAAAPAPPGPPTVMYVIPKCYLGNLPPRQDRLPAGCNAKDVQILKPQAINATQQGNAK